MSRSPEPRSRSHRRGQVARGQRLAPRNLVTITGGAVPVPDPDAVVHLQLRRFAGCPVCNLHLRSVARRHDEIEVAGIREVVVFHAPAAELVPHCEGLPFPVVPDPGKRLYRELGVEESVWSLLHPRAWPGILKAVAVALAGFARGRTRAPRLLPHGGRFGLPADLLIAPDGTVLACKYGRWADDQWSVDELLALPRG